MMIWTQANDIRHRVGTTFMKGNDMVCLQIDRAVRPGEAGRAAIFTETGSASQCGATHTRIAHKDDAGLFATAHVISTDGLG